MMTPFLIGGRRDPHLGPTDEEYLKVTAKVTASSFASHFVVAFVVAFPTVPCAPRAWRRRAPVVWKTPQIRRHFPRAIVLRQFFSFKFRGLPAELGVVSRSLVDPFCRAARDGQKTLTRQVTTPAAASSKRSPRNLKEKN